MVSIALPSPNSKTLAQRDDIIRELTSLVGAGAVITDEDGRRAYETDALTAYTRMPLAVVSCRRVLAIFRNCCVTATQID